MSCRRTLGLYLHIPFCRSKCAYCDFYSLSLRDCAGSGKAPAHSAPSSMDDYTRALREHLAHFAACTDLTPYRVDTVYFGGGTPTVLGARRLLDIWETVVRCFPLASDVEVTLEANPDTTGIWLRDLCAAGFRRISLGMQSSDDGMLRRLGRIHSWAQTREAVDTARQAGFRNLSLDLIYGLPGETEAQWRRSLRDALSLEPEHLSCYGLKVEEGTPLWDRIRRGTEPALPEPEEQADRYLWTVEELERNGWKQYEISNFARPGFASRHNLKYWMLREYAGFGPGAHSDFGGVRYAYGRDLDAYVRDVAALGETDRKPDETGAALGEMGRKPDETGVTPGETGRKPDETGATPGETGSGKKDAELWNMGGKDIPCSAWEAIAPEERAREWVMLRLRTAEGLVGSEYDRRFFTGENQTAPPFQSFRPFLNRCAEAGYGRWDGDRFAMTPGGFLVSNQIIGELLGMWHSAGTGKGENLPFSGR